MWRCTGLRWQEGAPVWGWWHPGRGERSSPLALGGRIGLALAADAQRRCLGVRRNGRRTPCPSEAVLPYEARRDQCGVCSALDRSSSVAADTMADDPRPYAVYLAYFGPGLLKVGITSVARGPARLLEQGAVCFTFLGEGPLMTARRTEAVLGAALRVPDRVHSSAKRAALTVLPPPEERAAGLCTLYASVEAIRDRLPDSLRPRPLEVVDHAAVFGLDPAPPAPAGEITAFEPGGAVSGQVRVVAGHDLLVDTCAGKTLLLDARLTCGWGFQRAASGSPTRVRTAAWRSPPRAAPPLF
jgi:hypothetical protein